MYTSRMVEITYNDFEKVEIRVGTIIEVDDFPEARVPAYKLTIDFGAEICLKKSSSQLTDNYSKENLKGRQVLAVVNFPPRQVGKFMSEVLTLGFYDTDNKVVLAGPDNVIPNGTKLL